METASPNTLGHLDSRTAAHIVALVVETAIHLEREGVWGLERPTTIGMLVDATSKAVPALNPETEVADAGLQQ